MSRRHNRSSRRQSGKALGSIVLLLLLASGIGAWNYRRNLALEAQQEGHRPYAGYATEDLESLRAAYSAELTGSEARFAQAQQQRVRPQGDKGSISGNVAQFEQTARNSQRIRRAAAGVANRQNEIDALDKELQLRADKADLVALHVRRLTSL